MTNIIKNTKKLKKVGKELNLSGITQQQGRLTALKCVPIRNKKECMSNYRYWLCICHHNNAQFEQFITKNIIKITEIAEKAFRKTCEQLTIDFSEKTILRFVNTRSIKIFSQQNSKDFKDELIDFLGNTQNLEEKYPLLFNIIHNGDKTILPKTLIIRGSYFSTNYVCSCGCIRKEKLKRISFSNNGEIVSSSIYNIAKEYSVSRDLIRRRTREKNENGNKITLEQIVIGNGSRKNQSPAYTMAEAVNLYLNKTATSFDDICIEANLTHQEETILYYRLICNPVKKLQEIADSEEFLSSREWIRRIELEGLKKICRRFNLL